MADALQEAPLKKNVDEFPKETAALAQKFDPLKKYMFELAEENPARELPVFDMAAKRNAPHKKYRPSHNIVLTSQVIWQGQRRMLRYYDGCSSIFVDEQPKDEKQIETYIRQTQIRRFLNGKFGCFGDERMLLLYLFICSWNTESKFRTRSANHVFKAVDSGKKASLEADRMDKMEEALKYAREATTSKMMMHANYLGIPVIDYDSSNELTEKEIRPEYRKSASQDPYEFIKSYNDKSIEAKYYINKALETGLISNKFNPNKATWGKNNTEICDISGLRTPEAIAEKLLEFSQLDEGAEFSIQLKTLFK